MSNPNYNVIIPSTVRYDINLTPNAKLLYGEINALCSKYGFCWASNNYFSRLYNTTERTIIRCLNLLKEKQYITISYNDDEYERKIFLSNNNENISVTKLSYPHDKNVTHNNKSNNINIKEKDNNKLLSKKKGFQKPTLEEVKIYCMERNNGIDAELFIDYYESNGWKIGNNKMKDWKACIRNWERNILTPYKNKINNVPTINNNLPHWFDNKPVDTEMTKEEEEEFDRELEELQKLLV